MIFLASEQRLKKIEELPNKELTERQKEKNTIPCGKCWRAGGKVTIYLDLNEHEKKMLRLAFENQSEIIFTTGAKGRESKYVANIRRKIISMPITEGRFTAFEEMK